MKINPYQSPAIVSEKVRPPYSTRLSSGTLFCVCAVIGPVVFGCHIIGFYALLLAIYYPHPLPSGWLAVEPIAATVAFVFGLIFWRGELMVAWLWVGLWLFMPGLFLLMAYLI